MSFEKNVRFTYEPMPYGSVLIVDDVESIIFVAKGLMAPYGLTVSTVMSGFEAIEKVKGGQIYDIIFMDHMMPGMDGMEAAKIIRELGYNHPIVALTASTEDGQRELFLANGFDGYISKPIDVRQLNDILIKFIRPRHETGAANGAAVQTHDSGGHSAEKEIFVPPQLVEFFIRDASKAISTLRSLPDEGRFDGEKILLYTTSVHAMKSALLNIGQPELSARAEILEKAGNVNDISAIYDKTPAFVEQLEALVTKLKQEKESEDSDKASEDDYAEICDNLSMLIAACKNYDKAAAKAIVTALRRKTWTLEIDEMLGDMSGDLLSGDFSDVSRTAGKIIEVIKNS